MLRERKQEGERKSYESAGVVVPQGLGVPKGLQQRVGLQDDVFDVLSGHTMETVSNPVRHRASHVLTHTHTHTHTLNETEVVVLSKYRIQK